MKKIEMFETEDGEKFSSEEEAKEHEKEILIRNKFIEILEGVWYRSIDMADVVDTLMENVDKIKKILK